MSLGREAILETLYEYNENITQQEILSLEAQAGAEAGIWITKDGDVIKIADMSRSHIANCLNMLKKNNSIGAEFYIKAFEKEINRRNHPKKLNINIQ